MTTPSQTVYLHANLLSHNVHLSITPVPFFYDTLLIHTLLVHTLLIHTLLMPLPHSSRSNFQPNLTIWGGGGNITGTLQQDQRFQVGYRERAAWCSLGGDAACGGQLSPVIRFAIRRHSVSFESGPRLPVKRSLF